MIKYPFWYRQHGVRRPSMLRTPFLSDLSTLSLPREAILHYFPEDDVVYGIPGDDWLLKDDRIVFVDHVETLSSDKGSPRPVPVTPSKLVREYHRKNKRVKILRKIEMALSNPLIMLVENYAILNHLYRYTTSFYSGYYKWFNIRATMWNRINELAKQSDRQHFVKCNLPETLPTLMDFVQFEKRFSRTTLELFKGQDALALADLWNWLGEKREESSMAGLEVEQLDKVNLVWLCQGKWFVINLGLLNSWKSGEGEKQEGFEPRVLQKYLLKALMSLYETKTLSEDTETAVVEKTPKADDKAVDASLQTLKEESDNYLDEDIAELDQIHVDELELDEELNALNELSREIEEKNNADSSPVVLDKQIRSQQLDLSVGVVEKANELADAGLLSGAEYRRFMKLAEAHKAIKNPYGNGLLVEEAKIDPKTIQITKPTRFKDNPAVLDKSMLQNSVVDFDQRYIKEVLRKDILNSVLTVHNAGVAVTGYDVDTVEDAMGHYENHSVRLVPVNGSPSTIHFRLPVVKEDGTYIANGVKYRLRKQRGDVPIRKVSPTRVSLTSYYGKVFVERSERSVNNYGKWLLNNLTVKAFDENDLTLVEARSSNVFDQSFRVPRIYSLLSQRFRSFKTENYEFDLRYNRREELFGSELVKAAEKEGAVVIGKGKGRSKALVVVDDENTFYEYLNGNLTLIGKIETIVNLDVNSAPIDLAELKVFNKFIPMGFVFGYYIGLENLLKLLKVEYRRVLTGERLTLTQGEYVIRFSDEVLILNREDRLATLLLAGYNQYHRNIKNYSIYDFDRRDVYNAVLDNNKIGSRYLRELDLLRDMFVDPITRDLLVDMNEPTDWLGLLMRSTELLMTDYSPAETDMEWMRIKGYERMAGTVYGELVKSVRMFNGRQGARNNKIELSPSAVWQTLQEDPSKGLVEDLNPIENLREKEAVTYSGHGGRSRRSMVKSSRVFHESDLGVISEGTVDSGDVAIVSYLTADPNFTSLRGLSRRHDFGEDGPAKFLSTAAMVSPGADRDDPKRVNS